MAKSKKKTKTRNNNKSRRRPNKSTRPKSAENRLDQLLTAVRMHPDDIDARLALAEYYRRSDQTGRISELLEDLEPRYPFADKERRGRYNFLCAFGHAHRNRLVEAEKAARRGLDEFPDGLDFQYVLTYVYLSLREFDKVIPCAGAFIEAGEKLASEAQEPPFCSTVDDISQVHNFLGAAYSETGRLDEAEQCYRRAIKADPGNHLPYLNLIRLLNSSGRREEVPAVIEEGQRSCRQVQELRMLKTANRERASVSACLMVKNEEELLPQCLDSVRDWVDEIVVVDTGSSDRTVEIARSYGARIFHQPWEGSFSRHRNYSMEQAGCDWIFIIDADECIAREDVTLIRQLLDQKEHRVISINVFNVGGQNKETVTFLPSIRFFRRELGLKYEGIVHNLLKVPPEEPILRTGVRLNHYGYGLSAEKMKQKFERSRALLEKQLQDDPDNCYAHFNYAQLLRGQGLNDHPEYAPMILKAAQRALELSGPDDPETRHVHLMVLHQIAWVHFITGEYEKATESCLCALKHKSNYLDPMLLLGHIALRSGDYEQAEAHYRRYLDTQAGYDPAKEIDNLILLHPESRDSALYGLGAIAFEKAQYERAVEHFEQALKSCPGFLDTETRLGYSYVRLGRLEEAQACFQRALEADDSAVEAVIGLADVHYRRREYGQTEQFFRRALQLSPDHPGCLMKFGEFSLESGQYQQAAESFRKALAVGCDPLQVRPHLAEACFKMEQYAIAAELYCAIIDDCAADASIHNDLGNCFFNTQRYEEAEKRYLKALQLDEQHAAAWRNLGMARIKLNQAVEAAAALEKYLQLQPDEQDIYLVLGSLHAGQEAWDAAIACYERYLATHPADPLALFGLSECYFNMGHQESAMLGYRQVLALDADFQPARDRLVQITRSVERV